MSGLSYYGKVPPSDYSERIRKHGMTQRDAERLQAGLLKIRKVELDLQFTLAKLSAGLPLR